MRFAGQPTVNTMVYHHIIIIINTIAISQPTLVIVNTMVQGGPSINIQAMPSSNEIPDVDCLRRVVYITSLKFLSKPALIIIISM